MSFESKMSEIDGAWILFFENINGQNPFSKITVKKHSNYGQRN